MPMVKKPATKADKDPASKKSPKSAKTSDLAQTPRKPKGK
jgi:hypothetical protein